MRKFLEYSIEFFCWLWIFLLPTLILGFIGFAIYYNYAGNIGITSFILLPVLGVVFGIYLAEKIRISLGCTMFITRVSPWSDSKKNENK